jgi:hypothetical protein
MKKFLVWPCRILVAVTLLPALILTIPGFFLHIIVEEFIDP